MVGEYEHLREVPDYDNDPKYRLWGVPFISVWSPPLFGLLGGLTIGESVNILRKRPKFSSKQYY